MDTLRQSNLKILVSSNCITGGLAASLAKLTGFDSVAAIHVANENDEETKKKLETEIPKADIIFCTKNNSLCLSIIDELKRQESTIVFPPIFFKSFHPDIIYAWEIKSRKLTEIHYNSRIGVWAYQRGLSAEVASEFFEADVFKELGYLDTWPLEVQQLKKSFSECGLDSEFSDFFLETKRTGVFMHTVNHPCVSAVFSLAKVLATRAGIKINHAVKSTEVPDWLNGIIWPVYPPIAESLGLGIGSFRFNFAQRSMNFDGAQEYLEYTFRNYQSQGISPQDLAIAFTASSHSDSILDKIAGFSRP